MIQFQRTKFFKIKGEDSGVLNLEHIVLVL